MKAVNLSKTSKWKKLLTTDYNDLELFVCSNIFYYLDESLP